MSSPSSPSGLISSTNVTVDDLFIKLPKQYEEYNTLKNKYSNDVKESATLDGQIQELNTKLNEINRQEEVYDREFIDRKTNPRKTGFLYNLGLRTTEDFVLTYFFFSYIVFVFMVLITVLRYSTTKIVAAVIIISLALIFALFSIFLIYRYA
jgi:hypothetical protein